MQLASVVALAFAVRAFICYGAGLPWSTGDTRGYWVMARAILLGEPFSSMPNGYPLLLASLWSAIAPGEAPGTLTGELVAAGLAVNVALSTTTVALVFGLARGLGGTRVALLAAAAVAVYPNQVNYTRYLLTEVPTAFLLVLSLYLFARTRLTAAGASTSAGRAVASGVALGVGALFRSTLLPVAVPLVLVAWASGTVRSRALPFVLGLVAVLGIHQAAISAGYLASSSNVDRNLLTAIDERTDGRIDWSRSQFDEAERAAALTTYLTFARDHPGTFAAQRVRSAWELWGPWPSAGSADAPRGLARRLLIGLRFPLLVLGLCGLYLRRRDAVAWALAAPVFAVSALHIAFFGEARFTYIMEPSLLVLATVAVATAVRALRRSAPRESEAAPDGILPAS